MNLIDILLGPVAGLIEKYVPSAQDKQQATLDLLKLQQTSEFQQLDAQVKLAQAQTDVNKVEGANTNIFIAGWRPFIGWVCGTGLAVQFLIGPLFTWVAALAGHAVAFPSLDMGTLITLLAGMLGLGGMRTVEKLNGKA